MPPGFLSCTVLGERVHCACMSTIYKSAFKLLAAASLCAASGLAATYQANVAFPSSPQSQGCQINTTNITAVCYKALSGVYGTAIISGYSGGTEFHVLGSLQDTSPVGNSGTVKSNVSANLTSTDIAPLSGSGGITVTNLYLDDSEPIVVSVNGAEVTTLSGGDSINLSAATYGTMTIGLAASQTNTSSGATDNVNNFNVKLAAY